MIEEQLSASIFNFIMGLTQDKTYDPAIIDGYDCYFSVTAERKRRFVSEHEPDETVYNLSVWIDKIHAWSNDAEYVVMDSSAVQEGLDKLLYEFNRS